MTLDEELTLIANQARALMDATLNYQAALELRRMEIKHHGTEHYQPLLKQREREYRIALKLMRTEVK